MLLDLGHEGLGCPVEFEFSVDLNPSTAGIKGNFSILQMRPLVAGEARMDVHIDEDDIRRAFCYSTCCLGHGKSDDMADLVYVVPETFDPGKTVEISAEIGKLNTALLAQNKPYLLAGPGRWGSSDRFLGIPVKWKDISGGGAMMEIRNENISADPSEGSHFFHHITSLGIPYITVSEGTSDFFSWQWLATQPAENRTRYLRHICFKQPFVIKSNGRTGRCVVLRPESKKRSNTC